MKWLQSKRDLVRRAKSGQLWFCFSRTGTKAQSGILPDDVKALAIRPVEGGHEVFATSAGNAELPIDTFATGDLAHAAMRRLLVGHCESLWGGRLRRSLYWLIGALIFLLIMGGRNEGHSALPVSALPVVPSISDAGYPGVAARVAATPPEAAAPVPLQGNSLGAATMDVSKIQLDHTIAVGTAGKPKLFVFSDPLCPACQYMETVLPEVKAEFDIRIVPVPVKGQESASLVAQSFCSEEPAIAWHKVMQGSPVQLREADREKLTRCVQKGLDNYNLFKDAKLIATPSIVTADGRVRSNAMPAAELIAWAGKKGR